MNTVFSAFERLDSGPVELMRVPCHVFVKRCLQLVKSVSEHPRIKSVPVFFSALTPGQHVREATEWLTRKLGIKEAGPLKFSRSPRVGYPEKWPFLTPWRLFPSDVRSLSELPRWQNGSDLQDLAVGQFR